MTPFGMQALSNPLTGVHSAHVLGRTECQVDGTGESVSETTTFRLDAASAPNPRPPIAGPACRRYVTASRAQRGTTASCFEADTAREPTLLHSPVRRVPAANAAATVRCRLAYNDREPEPTWDGGVLRLAGGASLAMPDYIIVFDFPDDEPMYEHADGLLGGVMLTYVIEQAARYSDEYKATAVLASHNEAIRQFGAVCELVSEGSAA